MKFGKQLAKVVALSDPEWSPFWVSYKSLKKRVKDLTDAQNQAQRQAAAQQKQQQGGGVGGVNKMETDANSAVVQELSQKAGEVRIDLGGRGSPEHLTRSHPSSTGEFFQNHSC